MAAPTPEELAALKLGDYIKFCVVVRDGRRTATRKVNGFWHGKPTVGFWGCRGFVVNYAAAVIARGTMRSTTRHFDTCFEMYDGDEVAAALVRRAANNPKLAANLFRYINRQTATEAAERLKGKNLADEARKTRARKAAEFAAFMAGRD